MPTLEDKTNDTESIKLLRLFFYGFPKTRKTWLAGTAAEAGFNTILIDCDHGYHILMKQLSAKAKKRLYIFEARDTLSESIAAIFLTRFLSNGRAWFDEKTRKVIMSQSQLNENCAELSAEKHLNENTVLIVDSYTALVASLKFRYAIENKVDLTDPKKENREGYAWYGSMANFFLEKLTKLPCHLINIGHATVYEKYKTNAKGKQELDWSRRIIKSSSGPHSMTIADKFSDLLYFHNVSSQLTKIDTYAEKNAEGGSRIIPPGSYSWDKLQWKDICEYANIKLPPQDLPYLNFKPDISTGGNPDAIAKTIQTKPKLTNVKGLETKIPIKKTTPIIIPKK